METTDRVTLWIGALVVLSISYFPIYELYHNWDTISEPDFKASLVVLALTIIIPFVLIGVDLNMERIHRVLYGGSDRKFF